MCREADGGLRAASTRGKNRTHKGRANPPYEAWHDCCRTDGASEMRALGLDQANTIIGATFAAAEKHKCRPMSAVILDAGGRVKPFRKQDGASIRGFKICHGKAYASLALGRASRLVLQKAKEKPLFMQSVGELADGPLFLEGGGQLIRDAAGEVMGSICVTGDVNEMDDICAIAGIHAVGLKADCDFDDPEQ